MWIIERDKGIPSMLRLHYLKTDKPPGFSQTVFKCLFLCVSAFWKVLTAGEFFAGIRTFAYNSFYQFTIAPWAYGCLIRELAVDGFNMQILGVL